MISNSKYMKKACTQSFFNCFCDMQNGDTIVREALGLLIVPLNFALTLLKLR